jgi:hypothetical protein
MNRRTKFQFSQAKLTLKLTTLLLAFAAAFASCKDKEPLPTELFLIVDETPITVPAEGGTYTIAVSSNGVWTAVVEDAENHDWLTATKTNDSTITVNVNENSLFTTQSATVKVIMDTITKRVTINQDMVEEPEEPFLIVDETPLTVVARPGTYSIAVSSNGEWTAIVENAENHDWLALTKTNDSTIVVNVDENTLFETRSATVKITMDTIIRRVIINQNKAPVYVWQGEQRYYYDHFEGKIHLNEIENKIVVTVDASCLSEILPYLQENGQVECINRFRSDSTYVLTVMEYIDAKALMEILKTRVGIKSVSPAYTDIMRTMEIFTMNRIGIQFIGHPFDPEFVELLQKYRLEEVVNTTMPPITSFFVPVDLDPLEVANAIYISGLAFFSRPLFVSRPIP